MWIEYVHVEFVEEWNEDNETINDNINERSSR